MNSPAMNGDRIVLRDKVRAGVVWAWPARSKREDPIVRTVLVVRPGRAARSRSTEVLYRERGAGEPRVATCSIATWCRMTRRGIMLNGKPRGQ